MTNVTNTYPSNIYTYQPQNVLISYGITLLFVLLANALGFFPYVSNGVSHDNSFSSVMCTTRDIHLSKLNAHERLGALPLDKKVGSTKLRFYTGDKIGEKGERGGRWGFGLAREL